MKRTYIAFALLLCLLIPLLAGCAQRVDPATHELPDGWEIISQDDNVTHIRMKEGADNRVWMEHDGRSDFFTDIRLAGDKLYENRNCNTDESIPVVVYFGYGMLIKDDESGEYELSPDNFDSSGPYTLKMESEYYNNAPDVSISLLTLPNLRDTAKIEYKNEQVGYSEAIIVNLPMSILNGLLDISVEFGIYDSTAEISRGASFLSLHRNAGEDTVLVETSPNIKEETIRNSFPMVLFQAENILNYINLALILSAVVFAVLTAIQRKKQHIPYLIVLAALVFNLIMTAYFDFQNKGNNWDFSFLIFFVALQFYTVFTFGIALLQVILPWIVKIVQKKKAQANKPEATSADK